MHLHIPLKVLQSLSFYWPLPAEQKYSQSAFNKLHPPLEPYERQINGSPDESPKPKLSLSASGNLTKLNWFPKSTISTVKHHLRLIHVCCTNDRSLYQEEQLEFQDLFTQPRARVLINFASFQLLWNLYVWNLKPSRVQRVNNKAVYVEKWQLLHARNAFAAAQASHRSECPAWNCNEIHDLRIVHSRNICNRTRVISSFLFRYAFNIFFNNKSNFQVSKPRLVKKNQLWTET